MKCQKCAKPATFHITDIVEKGKHREFHFCDEHARQHLAPPEEALETPTDERARQEADRQRPGSLREPSPADKQVCPVCQITFLEFRNSGRLGCPYDYEVFRDELMPLLENIHGETRHSGKVPRRAPRNTPAADDPDPAPQRAEAGRRGRGLRGGGAAAGPDQGHRARAGAMTAAPHPGRTGVPGRPAGRPYQVVGPMRCQRCQKEASVHLTEPINGQRRELHLCPTVCPQGGSVLARIAAEPRAGRGGPEPDRGPRRRARRRAGRADLPRLRHQVHGVPGRRAARLPARLSGLRRRAAAAGPAVSRRDPARGQGRPAAARVPAIACGSAPGSARRSPAKITRRPRGCETSSAPRIPRMNSRRPDPNPPASGCVAPAPRATSSCARASGWRATSPTSRSPTGPAGARRPRSRPTSAPRSSTPGSSSPIFDVNGLGPLDRQFLVERQIISRELANGDGPARRRHQPAGKRRDHGQRGGPPPHPVHALGLPAPRGLGADQPARRPARGTARLRLQPPARLPDRLPDQRRHGHPRRRDAPPARAWSRPSRSTRSSAPSRRSTWPSAASTARGARPSATSTRSPTSRPWARASPS